MSVSQKKHSLFLNYTLYCMVPLTFYLFAVFCNSGYFGIDQYQIAGKLWMLELNQAIRPTIFSSYEHRSHISENNN